MQLPRLVRRFLRRRGASRGSLASTRVVPLSVLAGAVTSVALGMGLANALPTAGAETMPLSDVLPGMKGYGLTVFSGTEPERFDVEVIATLANFRPHQDLVLIKTPNHPRLDAARTVAGMSGSPIYLNGKMIGAYAYGWLFGAEPIAGVTPIQSMLDELARPIPKAIAPTGGGPLPSASRGAPRSSTSSRSFRGAIGGYDLASHARQLADSQNAAPSPSVTTLARASTPIMMGGVGDLGMRIAGDLLAPLGLEPLQAGGGSSKVDPGAPTRFVDGGAIGVQLVRGDISSMGLGTVTRVSGDKLVAFGHPMLNGGVEKLPTAIARVHWVLASQNRSFKIGEAIRPLGALINDRQAAIVVDQSVQAPMFPMHVAIEGAPGAPHPAWNVEIASDPFMAPAFVAMAMGNAFEATSSERNDMTWRAQHKLKISRYGTITLADYGAGNGGAPGPDDFVRSNLVKAMGALLNNPWETVSVEGVETSIEVRMEREVTRLRSAKVLASEIDAGAPARIRLQLEPYQGAIETRVIEVPIPAALAGTEVEIKLAPGYDVDRPQASPESVADLVATLPYETYDPQSLVAIVKTRETGAAFRGSVASRLPPGAVDTLRPVSDSDAPEMFSTEIPTVIPLKRFLVGRDAVRVTVRPVLR